jgi:hypothetical protein
MVAAENTQGVAEVRERMTYKLLEPPAPLPGASAYMAVYAE